MSKIYKDINGQSHRLDINTSKDLIEIDNLYRQSAQKAMEYANQYHTDVFYSLKLIDPIQRKIVKGMFFLIPIDRSEVENIINLYGADHTIGIAYCSEIKAPVVINTEKSGYDYEDECAEWLSLNGFEKVEITKKSGDQGIDIIAYNDGKKYGIQCKHYKGKVSNKAVQEAHTGAAYYNCDVAVVMTTGHFTQSAINLAHSINVKLWQKIRDGFDTAP